MRSYTTQKAIDEGWEQEVQFSVEDLKDILSIESYPRWADFDRFVLRKAIDEINLCSDLIHIEYAKNRGKGRNIEYVNFIISSARFKQILNARKEKRERL